MSLSIDVEKIKEVLLADRQWHQVADGSFEIDAYEFLRGSEFKPGVEEAGMLLKTGSEGLLSTRGARWSEVDSGGKRRLVFCPITAIQAISYGRYG